MPSNPPIFRGFCTFAPLVFSFPPPFANTQSFGCLETPGIGWWLDYRSEEKRQWAQWAAAEFPGTPRNHGQWADRQDGPPLKLGNPTEHQHGG